MAALESEVQSAQQLTPLEDYQFTGDSWTVSRKRTFILNYREHGSIFHAAKLTPVSRQTVYTWMSVDDQFAEAVADSKEDSLDDLETSVYRRAFTDSILAMFYLKAHRPKFRDKLAIDVSTVQGEIEERFAQLNIKQLPGVELPQFQLQPAPEQKEAQPTTDNNLPSGD